MVFCRIVWDSRLLFDFPPQTSNSKKTFFCTSRFLPAALSHMAACNGMSRRPPSTSYFTSATRFLGFRFVPEAHEYRVNVTNATRFRC